MATFNAGAAPATVSGEPITNDHWETGKVVSGQDP